MYYILELSNGTARMINFHHYAIVVAVKNGQKVLRENKNIVVNQVRFFGSFAKANNFYREHYGWKQL